MLSPLPLHTAVYPSASAGVPLVILHGFLGAGGNWHTLARRFATRRTVLVPDARNHGRSPHTDAFSYEAMAADVGAVLDAHGLDRAAFVGHSMGGKTAMHLALTRPERVERLVVVDIAPGVSPASHAPILDALAEIDLARLTQRAEVEAALASNVPDADTRGFLLKSLQRTPDGFRWALNVPVLRAHTGTVGAGIAGTLPASIRPYAGPTRFVRGGRSRYVTDADLPEIERLFPTADLVTIEGAGHWVHAEAPDALFEAVEAFLA